jgi:peptide/nickel transport system substrate-binding protein
MDCKRFCRIVLVLTACAALVWGVAGCNSSKSTDTTQAAQSTDASAQPVKDPVKKSTLRIGWSESPQAGMNPFLARNEGDYVFLGLMYEPLAMPMMDGTMQPWLAKSWTYNSADSSWTFVLDERAKWTDGQPVTADDVKYTFDTAYALDLPLGATTKAFVKSVDVVDAKTVSFKMKEPLAAFASLAGATLIMPKHIWATVGAVDKYENATPVGSGPFVFKEFKARAFLDVTAAPSYWRGPVNVSEVLVQVFSNPEAEVMALKTGDLDIIPDLSGSEALIPAVMSDANVKVLIDKWPHILYLAPNYRVPALANKDVRKAMDLAIDRQAIVNTALAGYGELPLMGYVPPVVTKWADTSLTWKGLGVAADQRAKDANAILDGLGYKAGSDGVRVGPDGKKLEFTIRCITYPSYVRTSELIKADLAKIGIKISVEVSDPETLYGGIIYSGKKSNDWQLLVHGSTMTPDPDNFAREYAPDTPTPWDNATAFGFTDPALQTLLQQSRREMDETKRIEMVKQAEQMFADQLVVISLAHRFHPAAYRTDKFTGWNPAPVNYGGMVHPLASIVNLTAISPK